MKRWLVGIAVFLVLGAMANIAVAWGCSQWSGRTDLNHYTLSEDGTAIREWWESNCPLRSFGDPDRLDISGEIGRRPHRTMSGGIAPGMNAWYFWLPVEDDQSHKRRIKGFVIFAGWPSLALSGQTWASDEGWFEPLTQRRYTYRWAIGRPMDLPDGHDDVWGWWFGERMIPLRPIWPGFAINTVFYAVGGWLLFAGPFVVRRWRRIRRGLCPKCAYDLRGAPQDATACPECGARWGSPECGEGVQGDAERSRPTTVVDVSESACRS